MHLVLCPSLMPPQRVLLQQGYDPLSFLSWEILPYTLIFLGLGRNFTVNLNVALSSIRYQKQWGLFHSLLMDGIWKVAGITRERACKSWSILSVLRPVCSKWDNMQTPWLSLLLIFLNNMCFLLKLIPKKLPPIRF